MIILTDEKNHLTILNTPYVKTSQQTGNFFKKLSQTVEGHLQISQSSENPYL